MKHLNKATGLALSLSSAITMAADPIKVESQGSVIGDDVLYSIGGAVPSRWAAPARWRASRSAPAGRTI